MKHLPIAVLALLSTLIAVPATADDDPTLSVRFTGDGAQEVPPVATDATATCSAVISPVEQTLTVECEHDVENVVAAHVHRAPAGENGPVLFAFSDPNSPISESFPIDDSTVDLFFDRELYVNLHSEEHPDGEVRAQVDGCFETPVSLCVQDDRFQITSVFSVDGGLGVARAFRFSDAGGFFTFFSDDNPEINVKVLDGCAINGHYWVFAAGLTDVASSLNILHVDSETLIPYSNEAGQPFELVRDIEAFACD